MQSNSTRCDGVMVDFIVGGPLSMSTEPGFPSQRVSFFVFFVCGLLVLLSLSHIRAYKYFSMMMPIIPHTAPCNTQYHVSCNVRKDTQSVHISVSMSLE